MTGFSTRTVLNKLRSNAAGAEACWVALSGGVDSTALLHCLAMADPAQLGMPLGAVHVNHHLQAAADDWAAQCAALCADLGVPCVVLDAAVDTRAGESPEAAAREARYRVLRDWLGENHALLTAHQEDDQAETLLLQLLRGSGPKGMAAMPESCRFGPGWLVRPCLDISRDALEDYGRRHGLGWIEDPTNTHSRYDRNFLRHEIMPRLRERWPNARRVLYRAARHQAEAASLLDHIAVDDLLQVGESAGTLGVRALLQLTAARRHNLLRYWLHSLGLPTPSEAVLEQIEAQALQAKPDATPRVHWPGAEVRRYRNELYAMTPVPVPETGLEWDWHGEPRELIVLCGRLEVSPASGPGLSPRAWEAHRATLRLRRGGESIKPLKRGHHHSLKHLYQEAGIPPWERDLIPLVYADEELVAVPGLCIAEGWQAADGESGVTLKWRRSQMRCDLGDAQP